MYRVFAVLVGALSLSACSSSPEWLSLDALKAAPPVDTVRFESEPPGAEAKASTGQTCRTPCALALPSSEPVTVTFTLTGYNPETETIEPLVETGGTPSLRPNPVLVALTAAPPPPKPVKKPAAKKPVAQKPAAKPAARPVAAQPAPMAPAQPAAPWPAPTR